MGKPWGEGQIQVLIIHFLGEGREGAAHLLSLEYGIQGNTYGRRGVGRLFFWVLSVFRLLIFLFFLSLLHN